MRQEFDKEFDALLRRTAGGARGAGAARGAARPSPASAHLDADERAAFAEGALPAAARAAYVSHLADCDDCRRSVAALSAAAGVAPALGRDEEGVEAGAGTQAAPPGRLSWLAGLFAPRVLRFAAPALALCLVGVVSFVALRSDRGREGFGAGQPGGGAPAAKDSGPNATAGAAGDGANADASANYNSAAAQQAPAAPGAGPSGVGTVGPAGGAPGHAAAGVASVQPVTRAEGPAPAAESAPQGGGTATTAAPAPSLAAAAEPREEAKKQEGERSRDARETGPASESVAVTSDRSDNVPDAYGTQRQAPDGARNRARNYPETGGLRNAPPPPPAPRQAESPQGRAPARRAQIDGAAEDDDGARTVEGRRFRRVGGAWVDANYKDSMPSTGVRRGTPAYEALVAELPEVGRVARHLSGEVVVVARGRAYRIRP